MKKILWYFKFNQKRKSIIDLIQVNITFYKWSLNDLSKDSFYKFVALTDIKVLYNKQLH